MKFALIDQIHDLQRGKKIVAVKAVSLAEEYLADHFPTFPVLPGVFILQGLIEAATWLACDALDFAPRVILLREAKNVTYKSFVKPGNLLRLEVTCRHMSADYSDFEGVGFCGEVEMVRARFQLAHHSIEHEPKMAPAVSPARLAERRARLEQLTQTRGLSSPSAASAVVQ